TGAKSLEDVTRLYEEMLRGMMSTPYYIGWHHCGYIEQWDASERGDAPRNENGFLDPLENHRTQWTDVLREKTWRPKFVDNELLATSPLPSWLFRSKCPCL
ncbi:hypothetical protein, partial [Novipirellula sp.]|uniref:hypothetical protein n=1 Tax=Novipirellula sp. TaxID=2795430 RepID=UPI003562B380